MVNHFSWVNLNPSKDPVIWRKYKIRLTQLLKKLRIVPLYSFHFLPINIFVPVFSCLHILQFRIGNRVTNPVDELTIFIVGNFSSIHPETTNGDRTIPCTKCISRILITWAHMEGSLRYVNHTRRLWKNILTARSNTMHLAIIRKATSLTIFLSKHSTTGKR